MEFIVKWAFYAVLICFCSKGVAHYAVVKYLLAKITTYFPRVFIGAFLYPFVKCDPKGASKPRKLPALHATESSSALALAHDIPGEERWDNNLTVLIAPRCWHILKVLRLCDHAVSGCYHLSVSHDFKTKILPIVFPCRISVVCFGFFFLSELWYYVPQRQMGFVCSLNLVWQSQIGDAWRPVQHHPLSLLLIQSTEGQCDHFCTKMAYVFQMKTVHILHKYLNGLASDCQDFRVLEL